MVEIPEWKFWKGTNSHYIIIIDCEIRKIYINNRWKGPSPNHLTSQESPSLKRQFFKRFNKNLIMLISILVLIETSLKGNGCNLTNSDRNHRNVSGILHSNSASKTDIIQTSPKICIKKLTKNEIDRCFDWIIFSLLGKLIDKQKKGVHPKRCSSGHCECSISV